MMQAQLISFRDDVTNALTQQNATMQAFMVSSQEQNQAVMATLAKQNELMMATWQRQDAMESRFTDYLAQQQKSDQAFRAEQETRIKQLEERPTTTEIVNNSISVHVEGDVKGVLNIEASNGKHQSGNGFFFVGIVLALLIFSMLSQRRINVANDGSIGFEDPCVRVEKVGKDLICRDN